MKDLTESLEELDRQLKTVSEETLREAGKLGVDLARSTTLFNHGTKFEEGIKFYQNSAYEGEVVSEAPYSEYLEFGNDSQGPFIYPVHAQALHFFIGDEEIFAKKVRSHPGYFFMEKTADVVEEKLPEIWASNFDKYIK